MDRAIVERAVRALAALNAEPSSKASSARTPSDVPVPVPRHRLNKQDNRAACGSPTCAGCYEVAQGVRIHPPKCGEDYRAWLDRWEAKGKPQ